MQIVKDGSRYLLFDRDGVLVDVVHDALEIEDVLASLREAEQHLIEELKKLLGEE